MSKPDEQCRQSVRKTKMPFALCWLLACACLAIVLAGCSQTGPASSGAASTSSANASGSTPASSAASASTSGAASSEVDESDFIGSWELARITSLDKNSEDSNITPEEIKTSREKGLDNYVVLNSDGTAVQVIWGVHLYGTWSIEPELAERGLGTGAIIRVAAPDEATASYIAFADGSKLEMGTGSKDLMVFEKAKDKKPVSKDEYHAALEAFVGTWHLDSASRDGITITRESGQISTDVTLEFKNSMKVTLVNGENTVEAPWGITGATTGYVYSPADGDKLTISDGVLTQDLGEKGTMSYVKE